MAAFTTIATAAALTATVGKNSSFICTSKQAKKDATKSRKRG